MPDGRFPKYFLLIYLSYPSGTDPTKSVCKGDAKLGRCLDKPSVYHIQVDQSGFLLAVKPGNGAKSNISHTSLPSGSPLFTVVFNSAFAKERWEQSPNMMPAQKSF